MQRLPFIASILFWLGWVVNIWLPLTYALQVFYFYAGLVVLLVHVLEVGIFFNRLRAAEGGLLHHMAMTLLFGVFHIRTLPK